MNEPRGIDLLEEEPARFTADEFLAIATQPPISEWIGKVELVRGVITRVSPVHLPHWTTQRMVHERLYDALRDAGIGLIVGYEPAVRLAADTVRVPDVAVLREPDAAARMFGREDVVLAVEIADTSLGIDLGPKRLAYAGAAVPLYWVVDVRDRVTHVMGDPADGDYRRQERIAFGTALAIPGTDRTIVIG